MLDVVPLVEISEWWLSVESPCIQDGSSPPSAL